MPAARVDTYKGPTRRTLITVSMHLHQECFSDLRYLSGEWRRYFYSLASSTRQRIKLNKIKTRLN